jgi:uncharacterized protein (DUF305 family)
MLMKKTIASFLLLGIVPLVPFSLSSCDDISARQSAGGNPSSSNLAHTDHGSMHSPSHSTSMPADHHSMTSMDLGPADKSFDLRLIDGMIPHHEGAVAMAQEALQKSNRPEIKQLAQAIIKAQEREIAELKQWRTAWYPKAGKEPMMYDAKMGHTMPMTKEMHSSMMMSGDLGAADNQFDLRFINAMIPHHQGAIDMAQQALAKSKRPDIKKLAQNIIDSQQQEINQMERWRKDWYGQ